MGNPHGLDPWRHSRYEFGGANWELLKVDIEPGKDLVFPWIQGVCAAITVYSVFSFLFDGIANGTWFLAIGKVLLVYLVAQVVFHIHRTRVGLSTSKWNALFLKGLNPA